MIVVDIPTIQYRKDIKEICNPLKKLNISYFAHVHLDKNGSFSAICNNPEFAEIYYQKKYYNIDVHTANLDLFGKYVVWDHVPRDGKTLQMGIDAFDLGIKHTFSIIEKNKHGIDFYHFSTHLDSDLINQFYISNIGLLKLFINYFTKNIKQHRKLYKAYDYRTELDEHAKGYILKPDTHLILQKNKEEFIRSLNQNYRKDIAPNKINLTKREMEIVSKILNGYSAKAISNEFFISRRTVEHHTENIKNKFGATSKAELIKMAIQLFD
jgi:DNA-binding CsgD family transcriptional regulator